MRPPAGAAEGIVERLEQARFDDDRDDQPALNVKKINLALGQAMHLAEPTYPCLPLSTETRTPAELLIMSTAGRTSFAHPGAPSATCAGRS